MIPQFSNLVNSSFLLYLNHKFIDKGKAYTNTSSYFYPTNTTYYGYYTYASPFNQFVYDGSINGATIITGVYLNNSFLGTGQSGFVGVDYDRGRVYFNQPVTGSNLSGSYSVKDFNISLASMPEEKLLFETKYFLKPKVTQNATGIASDSISYPALIIKDVGGTNEPFAFGGLENTIINAGIFIFVDSQYLLDGAISILKDLKYEYFGLFETGEMPFNALGMVRTGGIFNYNSASLNKVSNGSGVFIENVNISRFERGNYNNLTNLNPQCYFAIADFKLSFPRYPRA